MRDIISYESLIGEKPEEKTNEIDDELHLTGGNLRLCEVMCNSHAHRVLGEPEWEPSHQGLVLEQDVVVWSLSHVHL